MSGGGARRWVATAVRLFIGGGLCALLVARSDLRAIVRVFANVEPWPLVLSGVVALVTLRMTALRWRAFVNANGQRLSAGQAVRLTFIGAFFNAFLPTGVGGDAYKAVRLQKDFGELGAPLGSVFLDRLSGVVGLALVGLAGALERVLHGNTNDVVFACVGAAVAVLFGTALLLWVGDRLPSKGLGVVGRISSVAAQTLKTARRPPQLVAGAVGGVVAQIMAVIAVALIAAAMDIALPLGALAAVLLIAGLAAMIPLSLNGLGFREAALIWGLQPWGVSSDRAIAVGLMILVVSLVTSGVGALVYVTERPAQS